MESETQQRDYVGAPRVRLEDAGLLRGADQFTGDLRVPGMLHARFVRSTVAHARILAIDTSAAVVARGVVAVLTGHDLQLAPVHFPMFSWMFGPGFHRPLLPTDTVRFVGEVVAVIVAETAAEAEDAAELVVIDLEPVDAVVDPEAAMGSDAPLLFPAEGTNVAVNVPYEAGQRPQGTTVTTKVRVNNHRMAVSPMEGLAILAVPEPDGSRVTVWLSGQMPHQQRDATAAFVGMDADDLRVVCPAVGGGFGGKTPVEPDYILITGVARHLSRPVHWIQPRHENLLTMQARGHRFDVELEAFPDGRLASLRVDALSDLGAFPDVGAGMTLTSRGHATGVYEVPHVRFDIRGVTTNTAPVGAFRGAGRPEGIAMLERSMDALAADLGLDPVVVRRRNLIRRDQFPYANLVGNTYDTGDYERVLDVALEAAGYDALRAEQARRRATVREPWLGIGISLFVEISAGGPTARAEYAAVEITAAGDVELTVGSSAHGQGHWTTFAQIVSSVLGIPAARVTFVQGDTGVVPWGTGTGGSRSAQMAGNAVHAGAVEVLDRARRLAAHLLEADPEDVDISGADGLAVRGVPTSLVTWAELVEAASDPSLLLDGMTSRLFADPGFAQAGGGTAPFGCHIAVIEIDRETGAVELARMIAVDDCGTVLNPMLADGQVHGGLAAGIGQALYEESRFDEFGNPLTTTFVDYAMPSAAELPSFETHHTVTPTDKNPLGAKGLGEAGTTGSIAAVHNAVVDALAHLGVRHVELPATPLRIWQTIRDAQSTNTA